MRVLTFAELLQAAPSPPQIDLSALDVREGARRVVASLAASAFPGQPIAVCYFAGPLIPSVESPAWAADALRAAIAAEGVNYKLHRHYPYISDLSYLAASPDWSDPAFPRNFPPAACGADAGRQPRLALAPLMIGPHGFGAHQPGERVLRRHAFEILPRLLVRAALELAKAQPAD